MTRMYRGALMTEQTEPRRILSQEEWDRLIALLSLYNDLTVTQIDRHESIELQNLLSKLWAE